MPQVLLECVKTIYVRLRKLRFLNEDLANAFDNAIAHVFENMCAYLCGALPPLDMCAAWCNEVVQYGVLSLALQIRAMSRIPQHSIPCWVRMTRKEAQFLMPMLSAVLTRVVVAMTPYRRLLTSPILDVYNIDSEVLDSNGSFQSLLAVLELVSCYYCLA